LLTHPTSGVQARRILLDGIQRDEDSGMNSFKRLIWLRQVGLDLRNPLIWISPRIVIADKISEVEIFSETMTSRTALKVSECPHQLCAVTIEWSGSIGRGNHPHDGDKTPPLLRGSKGEHRHRPISNHKGTLPDVQHLDR
jgi:hypothetical protein